MNNEIKEILAELQKVANRETASRNALMEMKDKDYQLLLDYITNLQEYYNNNVNKYEDLLVKYSDLLDELKLKNDFIQDLLLIIYKSNDNKLHTEAHLCGEEYQDKLKVFKGE